MKLPSAITAGLASAALASCGPAPCDLKRITQVIHDEIRDDGRSPAEYVMEPPVRDGAHLYVGMAQKLNLYYRRHYWMDPRTCAIAKIRIDQ